MFECESPQSMSPHKILSIQHRLSNIAILSCIALHCIGVGYSFLILTYGGVQRLYHLGFSHQQHQPHVLVHDTAHPSTLVQRRWLSGEDGPFDEGGETRPGLFQSSILNYVILLILPGAVLPAHYWLEIKIHGGSPTDI
ncbi:hypothetical protein BO82DRAFT_217088 [Aspergillus uvarum CBS 121591]|uniref:Uncharacterized protein n=1 Tax=Aspergillus uvarum CBS 121591 TaxID=1448315 RepID=A0A319D7Y9_9EURO|nr:hypothetical protein BO82DRAFT_217088 [Aspergillus uvarum CBS 121591]PYH76072.1 hypothetical protein BO82DRAFT_217088 [Aspergillus uvarum CBS 121591]